MINYYKTIDNKIKKIDTMQQDCWISLIAPDDTEIMMIAEHFRIDPYDLRSALDKDERSRIENEDEYTMVLVNIPTLLVHTDQELYDTIPLAVFLAGKNVITICTEETPVLKAFVSGKIKEFNTGMRSRFVLQVLYRTASLYLQYLREIDKKSEAIESNLHKSTENSELLELLKLEKSLVYFTTALRSNETVMEKLFKNSNIKRYPEDDDLLDDVIVENKQAIEMANIYSGVLSSMVDAFASVISNNLNIVMKVLAIVTVVMAIPTMIFSAYGMNVSSTGMPFANEPYGFWTIIVISLILSAIVTVIISKMKMFK